MPPPEPKPGLSFNQQKLIDEFAKANGVTGQQAMNAMLVMGARACAADSSIMFSPVQAQKMETFAHEATHVVQHRSSAQNDSMSKLLKK